MLADYEAGRVRNRAFESIRAGLETSYQVSDLMGALKALWTGSNTPTAKNPLRTLYIKELRRRWVELAAFDGFLRTVGTAGQLANHIVVFASEDHYAEDGRRLGPTWICPNCDMELAWPGDEHTCPACLHFSAIGHAHSPWFHDVFPAP